MASEFSVDELAELLETQFGIGPNDGLAVAFSGGGDSTTLLHALALAQPRIGFHLRALHVNHGLHPESSSWAMQCKEDCMKLGVSYQSGTVQVQKDHTKGIEAAAREARYNYLCRELGENESLVLAHHADDQFETLLFRLVRGAGARGLRAMQGDSTLHGCRLLRPLLGFSREQLQTWAKTKALNWVEDPANRDEHFDRVYLRNRVIPHLKQRWPSAAEQAAQSCRHLAEAVAIADEVAFNDLQAARISPTWIDEAPVFSCRQLAELPTHRLSNALRYWCGQFAPAPRGRLQSLLELVQSPTERGEIRYLNLVMRRYRDGLHTSTVAPVDDATIDSSINTHVLQPVPSSIAIGRFQLNWWQSAGQGVSLGRLQTLATPTLRTGKPSEPLRMLWKGHHRSLKQLCQSHAVPPWDRVALPRLMTEDGEIVALPGLCVSDRWTAGPGEAGICFRLTRAHGLDLDEKWTKSS